MRDKPANDDQPEAFRAILYTTEKLANEIENIHGHPCSTVITSDRYEIAGRVAREVQKIVPRVKPPIRERLHTVTTHKILGYPIMILVVLSIFNGIFTFGDYTSELLGELFCGLEPIIEDLFGVGRKDETIAGGRCPVVPTEIFHHTQSIADQLKEDVRTKKLNKDLGGKKVMLLTTDVHEYAKMVIGIALEEANVAVIDLGHHVDPEQIVKALLKTRVDGVCISTHNGMALSYAVKLLKSWSATA